MTQGQLKIPMDWGWWLWSDQSALHSNGSVTEQGGWAGLTVSPCGWSVCGCQSHGRKTHHVVLSLPSTNPLCLSVLASRLSESIKSRPYNYKVLTDIFYKK